MSPEHGTRGDKGTPRRLTANAVIIAGSASDPHVLAVAGELRRRATPVVVGSVPELALMGLTWRAGRGTSLRVDH